MNRLASCGLVALLCLATAARAELHLALSDCGGVDYAEWSCASDSGTAFVVVASVDAPVLVALVGEESTIELQFQAPVPAWWKVGAGRCRPTEAVVVGFDVSPPACFDYFGSIPGGLIGANTYQIGPDAAVGDPNGPIQDDRIRIRTLSAPVDFDAAVHAPQPAPGTELFLYSITVRRQRTTGADACAGCGACVQMVFVNLKLLQPNGVGDIRYGDWWDLRSFWLQSASIGDYRLCQITPANRTTWGQIKTLYR